MLPELKTPPVPVRVRGLSKRFDSVQALDGVTIDFPAGSFFTLLGPSGCGKTTLLRIIAGFLEPSSGEVWLGDSNVVDTPPWRRRIGFVFQNYALWPNMTVLNNVAYGLRLRRAPRHEIRRLVEAGLERVGLGGLADRFPGQLSGGQQQRVALARALVLQPRVLLLDEPLSNLDARLRLEMRRELRRLQEEIGVTAIYVTHDQEEALQISDRIAVMNRGVVEQIGAPEEIYERPASAFVATFMGSVSLLHGRVTPVGSLLLEEGIELAVDLGQAASGRRVTIGVRPENVTITAPAGAGTVRGTVLGSAYLGHRRLTTFELAPGIRLSAEHRERLEPGDAVTLRVERFNVIEEAK
jgi:ABC-type Fe3+/spermidine/putrescine transport system ATPase subunit